MAKIELKEHEKLILARRRRGENQTQAATRLGVSYDAYSGWERNLVEEWVPKTTLLKVTRLEKAYILRRRTKMTRKELARKLDVSLTWLGYMETGKVCAGRLFCYWGMEHEQD